MATGDAAQSPDEDALWRFSLAFYALPGVAPALIALQDRDGLDVNLMLFALWLGISGRGRLNKDELRAADRAVSTIRTEVVAPLRALRRRLKQSPDADVQRLRENIKALELSAEKLVQTRLAGLASALGRDIPPGVRLDAARANLVLYISPDRAGSAEAAVVQRALEAFLPEH